MIVLDCFSLKYTALKQFLNRWRKIKIKASKESFNFFFPSCPTEKSSYLFLANLIGFFKCLDVQQLNKVLKRLIMPGSQTFSVRLCFK